MDFFGITSVPGSSTRGGVRALLMLAKVLKNGSHVAMTPDGPKGPLHEVKGGIIKLAQRTGAKIYPVAIIAENKWEFKSWDKMFVPKPFSRATFSMGNPLSIPPTITAAEFEDFTHELKTRLEALE